MSQNFDDPAILIEYTLSGATKNGIANFHKFATTIDNLDMKYLRDKLSGEERNAFWNEFANELITFSNGQSCWVSKD